MAGIGSPHWGPAEPQTGESAQAVERLLDAGNIANGPRRHATALPIVEDLNALAGRKKALPVRIVARRVFHGVAVDVMEPLFAETTGCHYQPSSAHGEQTEAIQDLPGVVVHLVETGAQKVAGILQRSSRGDVAGTLQQIPALRQREEIPLQPAPFPDPAPV